MDKRTLFTIFGVLTLVLSTAFAAAAIPIDDPDEDGLPIGRDNCDYVYNPDQSDSDSDGTGDACDPDTPGTHQCGYPPINGDVNDPDGDGVPNSRDNCDCTSNPNQLDSDSDGIGDACDPSTPTCTPSTEICDQKDNDCDEQVDEGNVCTNPSPSYTITKTVSPSSVRDGELVTYTVAISNANDNPGSVTLSDTFTYSDVIYSNGAALRFVPSEVLSNLDGVTTSGTLSGNGITFTNIRSSNGPVRVTYTARAETPSLFSGSATISNEARLSNGQSADTSVTVLPTTIGTGQLDISKSVSDAAPAHGDIITYTITVRNTGDATVNEAIVRDSIGRSATQTLRGTTSNGFPGGRIVALGTQSVSGNYDTSTSILTPRGVRLLNIPSDGTVTISYPARVDTGDLGNDITSVVFNTADVGTLSANARVDLRGSVVPPPTTPGRSSPPFILPIPAQVQTCGIGFGPIDLDEYVSDPDTGSANLSFSIDGNRYFQARVDPASHVLTVSDPSGVQDGVNENLRLTVRDPQGNIATRTITYSVLRTTFGKPIISGIPDQIVRKNRDFDEFDLDVYTQIGGTPLGNRTADYYVVGSTLFDVIISAENRVEIKYDEDLFAFTDADQISEELTFVMRGCSEAKDTAVFTVMREIPGTVIPRPPGDHTCVIVPRPGVMIDDTDCDGVPDGDDNCVDIKNPDQRDNDRNGVGDACDMSVSCEPTVTTGLDAGKSLQVRVGLENNMESQSATARYSVGIERLGVSESRTTASVARGEIGEAILRLRIPECVAEGRYTLTCTVQMSGHTATEARTIQVSPSESCSPSEDDSDARIFQMQDVIIGSPYGASYPITITNNGEQQRSYVLEVDGVLPWGDYIFEGGSVVVVPPGTKETTNLRVYALTEANPGTYPFKVTVRSGEEQEETYLQASVMPDETLTAGRGGVRASDVVWLFLIVLVLGAILFFAYRASQKAKRE